MDLRKVDLNLLVSLDALLDCCNVTKAAERLHLSQPALSAQLVRLRHLFGDPLLMPAGGGRGMTPTARALTLRGDLRAALSRLEKVVSEQASFDPQRDQRSFAIAATDNAGTVIGLPLLARLAAAAGPGIRLAFIALNPGRIVEQLESGEVDVMIAHQLVVPPNLPARKLREEGFVMAQRKGHPRGLAPPDIDAYCELQQLVVSPEGGRFEGMTDNVLQAIGRQRRVGLSVNNFLLAINILQATDYVCTLPRRLAQHFAAQLDTCELPFAHPGIAIYAAWHPRNQHEPGHLWLRSQVAAAAGLPADPPA